MNAILRPGERLLHGEVYVFNGELLKQHMAAEAMKALPEDLAALSDSELNGLFYEWLTASAKLGDDVAEQGRRICAERERRPWYARAFGRRRTGEESQEDAA